MVTWWLVVGLFTLATACDVSQAVPAARLQKAFPKDGNLEPPTAEGLQPGELRTVEGEPVVGRTGPAGEVFEVAVRTSSDRTHLTRRFGTRTLELGARAAEPDLSQYPCSSCHFGLAVRDDVDRETDAHQNIQPVHPREIGARCTGCHAAEDVELLALGSGERATLDHAYRLCAQCHWAQVADWAAGAHGKRLDGWQGRRVVLGCADCHDPHRPAIETRIPFRPPHLPTRAGRN